LSAAHAESVQDANRRLVSNAMHELFVTRNAEKAVRLYFGKPYLQHNPTIADGADDLPKVIASLPANFKYQPGIIVAEGDIVMIHGLYTGWGPKPLVTVDIFRAKDGKLVEHWDVMQEEVPASQTKSGRPMFPITDAHLPAP
jgi:predicted SnoaL-like aldol condensation-catalyzing enzyme